MPGAGPRKSRHSSSSARCALVHVEAHPRSRDGRCTNDVVRATSVVQNTVTTQRAAPDSRYVFAKRNLAQLPFQYAQYPRAFRLASSVGKRLRR